MRVTTIEATDSGRCFTVFENHCKKSHFSTLRAKRATFIFFKHLNFRAKVVNIQKNWFECKIISWMDSSYEGLHWWTHRCFQHQKLPFLARKFKLRLFWWFSNTVCFPIFNASTSFSSFFFSQKSGFKYLRSKHFTTSLILIKPKWYGGSYALLRTTRWYSRPHLEMWWLAFSTQSHLEKRGPKQIRKCTF